MSEFMNDPATPLLAFTLAILMLSIALWVYVTRPENRIEPMDLEADDIQVVMIWDPNKEEWVFFDPMSATSWQRHRVAMRLKTLCTHCGNDFSKGTL